LKSPDRAPLATVFGAAFAVLSAVACGAGEEASPPPAALTVEARLARLAHDEKSLAPRPDLTNAYADDSAAAALGHKLFFDKRFSGALLDSDNTGGPETLGMQGETQRVACVGCHIPTSGFADTRSTRRQISLASGWTRRRSPALLDFAQRSLLMWDGRRDTAYNQVFGVIESPLEFNSSRLFVAQQLARYYRAEYEAVFGPMPPLDAFEAIVPEEAGCTEMPDDQLTGRCPKPGHDDENVIAILVNMGKAIAAYERLLTCGPGRFDAWIHGDAAALTEEEQAGARLFVEKGCDSCHSGPYLSDEAFHNVGAANVIVNFVEPYDDPGAVDGLPAALEDPLNSRGVHSDGDDGRLSRVSGDFEALRGAFRTPTLRCVSRRPSFLHAAQLRSLADAVYFFNLGGDPHGYQGVKDPRIVPLGLTSEERGQLVAFLKALDGSGPDPSLTAEPILPNE
jgi:cytochrome c peroxidase